MLALHLDNILFLLFVAVAILFQLLTRAATKSGRRPGGDQKRRSPSPTSPRREETEEDRIRKFLEALGQPTTSKPPPPVAPRTDIPPRPVAPVQPPPAMRPFARPRRVTVPKMITRIPVEVPKKKLGDTGSPTFELQTAPTESHGLPPIIATPAAASATAIQQKTAPKL